MSESTSSTSGTAAYDQYFQLLSTVQQQEATLAGKLRDLSEAERVADNLRWQVMAAESEVASIRAKMAMLVKQDAYVEVRSMHRSRDGACRECNRPAPCATFIAITGGISENE